MNLLGFFIHSNNISLLFVHNTHVGQINQRGLLFDWFAEIMTDNPSMDPNNRFFALERTLSLQNNSI